MDVQILEKFQRSLVAFFDELVEMFPNEEFVYLRIMVKDRIPSTQIIKYFVKVYAKLLLLLLLIFSDIII